MSACCYFLELVSYSVHSAVIILPDCRMEISSLSWDEVFQLYLSGQVPTMAI